MKEEVKVVNHGDSRPDPYQSIGDMVMKMRRKEVWAMVAEGETAPEGARTKVMGGKGKNAGRVKVFKGHTMVMEGETNRDMKQVKASYARTNGLSNEIGDAATATATTNWLTAYPARVKEWEAQLEEAGHKTDLSWMTAVPVKKAKADKVVEPTITVQNVA